MYRSLAGAGADRFRPTHDSRWMTILWFNVPSSLCLICPWRRGVTLGAWSEKLAGKEVLRKHVKHAMDNLASQNATSVLASTFAFNGSELYIFYRSLIRLSVATSLSIQQSGSPRSIRAKEALRG